MCDVSALLEQLAKRFADNPNTESDLESLVDTLIENMADACQDLGFNSGLHDDDGELSALGARLYDLIAYGHLDTE